MKDNTMGSSVREGVEFSLENKGSDISGVLGDVSDLYGNQNLGAVVLATDGIYNEGSNPLSTGTKMNAPRYTIGLGDTLQKKDLPVLLADFLYSHNKHYIGLKKCDELAKEFLKKKEAAKRKSLY